MQESGRIHYGQADALWSSGCTKVERIELADSGPYIVQDLASMRNLMLRT
ncbi:MAG: hypothetical protein RH862_18290 [Leptospiraceae bacterium]